MVIFILPNTVYVSINILIWLGYFKAKNVDEFILPKEYMDNCIYDSEIKNSTSKTQIIIVITLSLLVSLTA